MVFGVLVDLPQVVQRLICHNVVGAKHGGHHRVVLIIVFVHAIAANMTDEQFTKLTGSSVEDVFCSSSLVDDKDNWSEKVANIQLRINTKKYLQVQSFKDKSYPIN